ncbi:MAG TPA: response regulator [Verrucomicrobiae bacterium]|nr:response regulator [Verrucomicrobiae bacterium]
MDAPTEKEDNECGRWKDFINEHASAPMSEVLLQIEDDLQDVELFRIAVAKSGLSYKVISVQYARDAIKYLGRFGEYADMEKYPKPKLIVLDLSLPGMTGLEFLAWAKGEPPENIPPIVVLSYSKLELNRHLSERLGAKAFFVKSPNPEESAEMTKNLLQFSAPPPSARALHP